jgi:hypothetical protein
MRVRGVLAAPVAVVFCCASSAALGAVPVTPGWECVPTTAGQPVVSGGTGASPSCGAGSTAVLAPTYVSSGVGGKPTVEFSTVNVQIVDGSGSTSAVNGTGNLVLGYDELARTQTGSHDLVLGEDQQFTGYSELVAGYDSTVSGKYASVLGGYKNTAKSAYSTVSGGCSNLAGSGTLSVPFTCDNAKNVGFFASVSGGAGNQATGLDSSIYQRPRTPHPRDLPGLSLAMVTTRIVAQRRSRV